MTEEKIKITIFDGLVISYLLLATIPSFQVQFFNFLSYSKNNLTKLLPSLKNEVINKVISPTGFVVFIKLLLHEPIFYNR